MALVIGSCMLPSLHATSRDQTPVVSSSRHTEKVIAGIELVGNKSYEEQVGINISGPQGGTKDN